MIGRTLGHYRIESKLGQGGMGVVYRATDIHLDRFVAIKVLPQDRVSDPERKRRFVQEAKAASALNHPGILHIYDIDTEAGVDYMAMEYVEGQTLQQRIGGRGVPVAEALQYAVQVAAALAAAHEAGIVHRDVKPANIMVSGKGLVKVLDFGLAKLIEPQADEPDAPTQSLRTADGAILGTAAYMSPEQAKGQKVDARSDIFSFGAVLYEMLTGRRAFEGHAQAEALGAVLHVEPAPVRELVPGIPDELEKLISRCLRKDPDARIQHMGDVRLALDELRQESGSGRVATPAPHGKGFLWVAAPLAAVGLLVAILALSPNLGRLRDRVFGRSAPAIEAIAVLPLQNLSGNPEQEYFADGMTEALITDLSKIRGVKVISRTSSMRYKGTKKPLREIAGELNVNALVEGSAMRVGDRVRITAQLIDVKTDQSLWAESYERDLRDVLILQGEVARAIAREIQVAVTPEESRRLGSSRRVHPEAYEAYLKGRFHWYQLSPEGLQRALEYFQLALQEDPNSALAYAGIADAWGAIGYWGVRPVRETVPKVRAAAYKAMELDDSLAEVHQMVAKTMFFVEWDWDAAEKEFRRAIELRPNHADVRSEYSMFLAAMKRTEEAKAQVEQALELDPLNPLFQVIQGWHFLFTGRDDDAIRQFRGTLSKGPNLPAAYSGLWAAFGRKGIEDEGLAAAQRFFALFGSREAGEAMTRGYASGGYSAAMRLAAEVLESRSRAAYVSPIWIATLYAHAGDRKSSLTWLEKAYEERNPNVATLSADPHWYNLRGEPGFQDLLRRLKLPM